MPLPMAITDVLDGEQLDPDAFTYGKGHPLRATERSVPYIDLTSLDVWLFHSGHSCDTSVGPSVDGGAAAWAKVSSFKDLVSTAALKANTGGAIERDIEFVRGNEWSETYLLKNVCYTLERPTRNGVPLQDPNPRDPLAVNTLPAPWEPRYFFAEIRDSYISSVRYHNGWVPWFGTWPNWVWWETYSLKGVMETTSVWSDEHNGTLVTVTLPSWMSVHIRASRSYHWDLESALGETFNDDGEPTNFSGIKTHVRGRCSVLNTYTRIQAV